MAQQLTEIFTKMPRGPEAIQDDLQKLNLADAVYHDWTSEGLILLNGAKRRSDYNETNVKQFHYSYIQFQGFKLVNLNISFSNITQTNTDAVQLPSGLAPNVLVNTVGQAGSVSYGIYVSTDGKITPISPLDNFTSNSLYHCHCTYIRKDD